jgi:hypothetical protein
MCIARAASAGAVADCWQVVFVGILFEADPARCHWGHFFYVRRGEEEKEKEEVSSIFPATFLSPPPSR